MSDPILIAVLVVAAGIGLYVGWQLNNRFGSKSLEAMQKRADETMRAARRNAEKAKRKAILESKEEILRQRNQAERDLRSRKRQILKREREHKSAVQKLQDFEAELNRRQDSLQEGQAELEAKQAEVKAALQEYERLIEEQNTRLEEVSRMTRDEARRQLLTNLQAQTRLESAAKIKEIKDEAQRAADAEAVKIISLAIERCASDFSAERTISYFELPEGGELKGRIIGQEGKNIRAFEKATGIQLLLDEDATRSRERSPAGCWKRSSKTATSTPDG
jgi:ribonuclease Y